MEKLNSKIIYLFIFIFLCVSLLIYKDYGISIDEKWNRDYGIINYKFILDYFKLTYPEQFDFKNIENLNTYFDKFYGAFYEIINFIIVEIIFKKKTINEIYYLRHLINNVLFIFSLIFFYKTIEIIFKNKIYSLLAVLILYTSPRIFADSFYNGKDLAFLSIFIITFYFSVKLLEEIKFNYLILFSFFSAFSINLRFVSIFLPFLLTIFLILKQKIILKKNLLIIFFPFLFYFLITPFLWIDPTNNIIEIAKNTMSFDRMKNFYIMFLGKQTSAQFVSEFYLPLVFFFTTPLLISIFGFFGLIKIIKRLYKRLINLNNTNNQNIWKSKNEMLIVFSFSVFFIPIFFFYIFDSIIYNSWRHFFFIYPFFIIFTLSGIKLALIYFKKKFKIIQILLITLLLLENIFNIVKFHPYQYAYFNPLIEKKANKLFDIDYWGTANTDALKKIIDLSPAKNKIYVANASFTDLQLSSELLNANEKNKLIFVGQDYSKADFIFTNEVYEININYNKKYNFSSNFILVDQIKKGHIVINKIFKKN